MRIQNFALTDSNLTGWQILNLNDSRIVDTGLGALKNLLASPKETEQLIVNELLTQILKWANDQDTHFWDTAKRLERRIIITATNKTGHITNLSIRSQIIKKLFKGPDTATSYRIFELRIDVNDYVCRGNWRDVFDKPISLRLIFIPGFESKNFLGDNVTYSKYYVSFFDKTLDDKTEAILKIIYENYVEILQAIITFEA